MDIKFEVNGLYKKDVFKNVDFSLERGILCVLSKNSERSSALLDSLVGVRKSDGGEVIGNDNAAYLSKGSPLPGYLNAKEYLDFVLKIKKEAEIPGSALEITENFGEKIIETLSPLEKLSLGIAASLIGNPSFIALEEPYRDLTFDEYGDFKQLIISVSKQVPIIFSSSSVFECKEISDKTLVLSTGNQIYFGDTKTLFETDINETDICCLVKGEKETLIAAFERYDTVVEETVRENIYSVTVKNVPMFRAAETRSRIKKMLSKARLSLLEMRSEKEALLNIVGELSESDRKKRAEYDEKITAKTVKLTRSLVAFSHDEDDEDENDDTDVDGYESFESDEDDEFSENE